MKESERNFGYNIDRLQNPEKEVQHSIPGVFINMFNTVETKFNIGIGLFKKPTQAGKMKFMNLINT